MNQPRQLIIDTDPGVDDAIAILLALASPDVTVLGLTSVGGNVPLARATRNALALLEYAGRAADVPVAAGAARPRRGRFPYAYRFHGRSGLSRRLPEPRTRVDRAGAVEFLADQLARQPGQIHLVALGPLTNLARLERRHPGRLRQAASLVVMGGAVRVLGNVTPHAEFNFYSDPLAAAEVLATGVPLTLVDLGACRRVYLERHQAATLTGHGNLGQLAAQLLGNWFRQRPERTRFEFYDPLSLAAALDPAMLVTRPATVMVVAEEGERLGESRVIAEGGPVSVVEEVRQARFFDLLRETLGLTW